MPLGYVMQLGCYGKNKDFSHSQEGKWLMEKKPRDLLVSVQRPEEIAVMHCPVRTKDTTEIRKGNALADTTTKAAAQQPLRDCVVAAPIRNQSEWLNLIHPKTMHEKECSGAEKKQWEKTK